MVDRGEMISANPGDAHFYQRRVQDFYLSGWVARQNLLAPLAMRRQLYQIGGLAHAPIQLRAPLISTRPAARNSPCHRPVLQ